MRTRGGWFLRPVAHSTEERGARIRQNYTGRLPGRSCPLGREPWTPGPVLLHSRQFKQDRKFCPAAARTDLYSPYTRPGPLPESRLHLRSASLAAGFCRRPSSSCAWEEPQRQERADGAPCRAGSALWEGACPAPAGQRPGPAANTHSGRAGLSAAPRGRLNQGRGTHENRCF